MTSSTTWALGTFRRRNADGATAADFAGLVVGDLVVGDLVRDVGALALPGRAGATTREILDEWDAALPRLRELAASRDGDWLAMEHLDVRPPVEPRQILQAGANYRTHVMDLAAKHHDYSDGMTEAQVRAESAARLDQRAAGGTPFLFSGLITALGGPYDSVTLPGYSDQHDWELELAAVIGSRTYRVSPDQALEHVAGYTIANDLTTRDLVFGKESGALGADWLRSKNAPGFLPVGPYLVPREFVPDPNDLQITLALNGDVMQDESTKDMLFDVATLVSFASQTTLLLPGDLLLTGSPAGNGLHHGRLLRDGDVMEGTITGLGTQRTPCVAEPS